MNCPFAFGRQKRVLKLYSREPTFMDILDQFDFSKHLCFANMGKDRSQEDILDSPFTTTYFMFFLNPPKSSPFSPPKRLKGFLILQKRRERGNNPITQSL
jgi:hypothetical protein